MAVTAPPKPSPPKPSLVERLKTAQRPTLLWASLAVLVVLVVLPIGMLILGSLRDNPPGLPSALTLANYELLFTGEFVSLLRNSMVVATGSTAVSMVLGTALAAITVRTRLPYASVFENLIIVPAYITPFIGALGWTLLLSPEIGYVNAILARLGLPTVSIYSMWGIIWVMGLYFTPIAYLYMRPSFLRLDRSFEEAGRVIGATVWQTARRVVLPLTLPALLSAILIVFVQAIGQFSVPGILGPRADIEVLPTQIVRMTSQFPTNPNGAAVLGIALAAMTLAGLALNNRILRRKDFTTITSRGATPWRIDIGKWKIATVGLCVLYVLTAVVLPTAVMFLASFQPYLTTDITSVGLTLDNYVYVLTFPDVSQSIINSIVLAVGAAVTTTGLAVLLGYVIVRTKMAGRQAADYLSSSPLAIPHTVFGLAMLWTWVSIPVGIYATRWVLYIAYVALFLPFSVRAATSAFRQIDIALEDAARVNGASWLTTIRRIVAPLLGPALLSGAIIVLYHAVRELAASLLLYSAGSQVMSVAIWSMFGEGRFVQLFALAMINIAVVLLLVIAANRVARRFRAEGGAGLGMD